MGVIHLIPACSFIIPEQFFVVIFCLFKLWLHVFYNFCFHLMNRLFKWPAFLEEEIEAKGIRMFNKDENVESVTLLFYSYRVQETVQNFGYEVVNK